MKKTFKIFISSPYKDLIRERKIVKDTISEMECIPVFMENFPSSSEQAEALIRSKIDDCDCVVLLIGGKYGSVNQDTKISYTEFEYNYAISKGIPVLPFLYYDIQKLRYEKVDSDIELYNKQKEFRTRLENNHTCTYWKGSNSLKLFVTKSIQYFINHFNEDNKDVKEEQKPIKTETNNSEVSLWQNQVNRITSIFESDKHLNTVFLSEDSFLDFFVTTAKNKRLISSKDASYILSHFVPSYEVKVNIYSDNNGLITKSEDSIKYSTLEWFMIIGTLHSNVTSWYGHFKIDDMVRLINDFLNKQSKYRYIFNEKCREKYSNNKSAFILYEISIDTDDFYNVLCHLADCKLLINDAEEVDEKYINHNMSIQNYIRWQPSCFGSELLLLRNNINLGLY